LSPEPTYRKHLVGLVENEHLHAVGAEEPTLDHVLDTAGGADDHLRAVLQGLHVVADTGATDAGVALDAHEVANSDHHLLNLLSELAGGSEDQGLAGLDVRIDLLEDRDGESGRLAGTGLGLSDDIVPCAQRQYAPRRVQHDGHFSPLITGMMARCWIADGRSKP